MAAMICTVCGAQMNQHGEKLIYVEPRNGAEMVETADGSAHVSELRSQ